jgi:cytochrome oxidase Cu insertion factor (SCO1/SenC/PrrC family)
VATVWSRRWSAASAAPPVLFDLPEFALQDRAGRQVRLADLRGEPFVASFIFTRCGGVCPRITEQMIRLATLVQHPNLLRRVSFTVDPEYDTPAVLAAYARDHGIQDDRWLFLTGDPGTMRTLVHDGFKLAVENTGTAEEPIVHSTRLVLVDRRGRVRGYYEAFEEEAVGKLLSDLRAVMREN